MFDSCLTIVTNHYEKPQRISKDIYLIGIFWAQNSSIMTHMPNIELLRKFHKFYFSMFLYLIKKQIMNSWEPVSVIRE